MIVAPPAVAVARARPSKLPTIIVSIIVMTAIVGATFAYVGYQKNQRVATVTPPAQTSPPPAAPAPATPTPAPAPAVTPPAANVTTPTVTPTKEHPQAVTVTSKSGLWIRSTPDSSNRNNIISWIPNGGSVSVDEVGDFWWHGTYNGVTGYFAANYTR